MYNYLGFFVLLIWSTSAPLLKQIIINSNGNYLMVVFSYNVIASILSFILSFITKERFYFTKDVFNKKFLILILLNGFYDVFVALAITFSLVVQYAIIANYLWPILLLFLISFRDTKKVSLKALVCGLLGFISLINIIIPEDYNET